MATSINGYITGRDDDTEWVKDTEILYKIIADKGVCVMGRRTYDESVKYNAFPYQNALNIVVTHDQNLLSKSTDNVIFTQASLPDIIKLVQVKGHTEILLVGGGKLNAEFLAAGLIDEIMIDIHPIIIDHGIKLFEGNFPRVNLELIDTQKLKDGMVQNKYRVLK